MAFSVLLPTSDIQIIRITEALYNLRPGSTYLDNFKTYTAENGLEGFANALGNQFAESSNEDLAALVATNIHATGEEATAATTYLVGQFNAVEKEARGKVILDAVNLLAGNGSNASSSFNDDVKASLEYSKVAANTDVAASDVAADQAAAAEAALAKAAEALKLTTSEDNLTGTDGDDSFTAKIINNANTLQSGDVIDGGDGVDTLTADIGTSQAFAITVKTANVETVVIRAEARAELRDTNDNNMTDAVQIDAERMVGVTRYENNNSRADLIVEDVRIVEPGVKEITKDITIAMVSTDPGDVDFGVYFDQHSLVAEKAQTAGANLNIEIMDVRSAVAGLDPLKESPYKGFTFTMDGALVTIESDAINTAQTYDALLLAVQGAIAANDDISSKITAKKSGSYDVVDTDSGQSAKGEFIVLTNSGSETLNEGGFIADGVVPASSGLHTQMSTVDPDSAGNLITSKIILDDVGRGSNGGDLVVGGLSVGDTSGSEGVEEFDITVERDSILGNINSTNNTLREVFIENGTTKGDLTVNGHNAARDNDLPGDALQDNEFGFSDVRILDAHKMEGSVNLTAALTDNIVAKYLNRTDTQDDPAHDNKTFDPQETTQEEFVYTLGTNNDTLAMTISKSNGVATGTTSREDFELTIHGQAGNDTITTIIDDGEGLNTDHWYINSKQNSNLNVNGDAGDDTITTSGAGDVVIDAGAGHDTVYTDNTGEQKATWVFNTDGNHNSANNTAGETEGNPGVSDNDELNNNIDNLETDNRVDNLLSGGSLVVTFRHLATKSVTISNDNHNTSALRINQAIKSAIAGDEVLHHLIVAEDGPAETLVVTAKIDGDAEGYEGAAAVTDLTVRITAPTTVSDAVLEAVNANREVNLTAAEALTAMTESVAAWNTAYGEEFARDAAGNLIDGSDSNSTNDNTVTGGSGDDVIVLSTDDQDSSQETLVLTKSFGDDTVVNFNTAVDSEEMTNGNDVINLSALTSDANTAFTAEGNTVLSVNNEIIFTTYNRDTTTRDVDPVTMDAQVAGSVSAVANAALTGVVIARELNDNNETDNIVRVYTATAIDNDTADASLTFQGSIDFADTDVSDFTLVDFLAARQAGNEDNLDGGAGAGAGPQNAEIAITENRIGDNLVNETFSWVKTNGTFTITDFDVANDVLKLDLSEAAGQATNMTKLSDLTGFNLNGGEEVAVAANGITNEINVALGTGLDGAGMQVKLLGMTDLTVVNIEII